MGEKRGRMGFESSSEMTGYFYNHPILKSNICNGIIIGYWVNPSFPTDLMPEMTAFFD